MSKLAFKLFKSNTKAVDEYLKSIGGDYYNYDRCGVKTFEGHKEHGLTHTLKPDAKFVRLYGLDGRNIVAFHRSQIQFTEKKSSLPYLKNRKKKKQQSAQDQCP